MRRNNKLLKFNKIYKKYLIFCVVFLIGINPMTLFNLGNYIRNPLSTIDNTMITSLGIENGIIQQGWELVKKNNCTVLKAPVDDRLGSLSGSYMMLFGVQYLHPSNWESECSQNGLSRFLGELSEENPWQEITEKFTDILLDAGYTALGMDSACYNKMPFIYCFDVEPKEGWPPEYSWEEIMTEEWVEKARERVKEVSDKLRDDPLCIGCFLENEIFWHWRDLNISKDEWIAAHNRFIDVMVSAIKEYAPHWLIFSNKYAAALMEDAWEWMSPQIMRDAFLYDIEAGVDVICINDYLYSEEEARQIGPKLKMYEDILSAETNKSVTVMLSETGFQANRYEREKSLEEGHRYDLYERYTSTIYPQVDNQSERVRMMGITIDSIVKNGGLGLFMHAACDHGPQYAPWWQIWRRCSRYMNWGVYDPWRDKLYNEFLDGIKEVYKQAREKREHDMNITLWYGGPSDSDLDCDGELVWKDVKPGEILMGSFVIKNIGAINSELSWRVVSYPDWGEWTFTPLSGNNLTSGNSIIVEVSLVAPDEEERYSDYIQIVNTEDNKDFSVIPVILLPPQKIWSSWVPLGLPEGDNERKNPFSIL